MLIEAQRRLRGVRGIERCGTLGNFGFASVSPGLRGDSEPGPSVRSGLFCPVKRGAQRP